MPTLKVSVGIPAHNEERNIRQLSESVLKQSGESFQILEIIVISDGSTDRTVVELRSINDPKVRILDYPDRAGAAIRQNEILSSFGGDILILLNADIRIQDDEFISKIIQPILADDKVGIVSPKVMPLLAENFFERVINFSVRLKDEIYEQLSPNNIYLCHGRARVLSKAYAKLLRFPGIVSEDAYSYITCINQGFKFHYEKSTQVFYRSPQNLADHLKQSKRFFGGRKMLSQSFGKVVDQYYHIPMNLIILTTSKFFFINPIYFVSYFSVLLWSRILSFFYKPDAVWEEAASSKKL